MAATQSQRAALYASLVESMGEEAADTLMDQLPPSSWDQMATKEDLAGVELRLQAAFTAAIAETNIKLAEANARITETNAELRASMDAGFAELRAAIAIGLAEAAKEQAQIIRSQAKQLYVIVATIAAGTLSIWIALFSGAGGA